MKVTHEYDQDPRYGWARVELSERDCLIVVVDENSIHYGFNFRDGEMVRACICHATSRDECCCYNDPWGEY